MLGISLTNSTKKDYIFGLSLNNALAVYYPGQQYQKCKKGWSFLLLYLQKKLEISRISSQDSERNEVSDL